MGWRERKGRHGRDRYARMSAQLARAFGAIVMLLTVFALYVDLSSAVGGLRRREHLMVVARQARGLVVFEAYENDWPFRWRQRPSDIAVLRVIDWIEGTTLWEIEAPRPRRVVVTYGQVPTGFTQTIPGSGVPTPLKPGASYGVTVRGTGGSAVTTFNKLLTKVAG